MSLIRLISYIICNKLSYLLNFLGIIDAECDVFSVTHFNF